MSVVQYPPGVQKGTVDQSAGPSTTADGGEFTELKQILEQKTFTRQVFIFLLFLFGPDKFFVNLS